MYVMVPGHAYAAVDLHTLLNDGRCPLSDVGLGHAHEMGRFFVVCLQGGYRRSGCRLTSLEPQQHIGEAVLNRLIRPYGPAKRDPVFGVLKSEFKDALNGADRFRDLKN